MILRECEEPATNTHPPVKQLTLFSDEIQSNKADTTSTFADNLSLPIHRWFRYSAGFSAPWVQEILERQHAEGRNTVLDPFCGSGTVLLEGERCAVTAIGVEAHPFVARVGRAKLHWRTNPKIFREYAFSILEKATTESGIPSGYPKLIEKCFPSTTLAQLDSLRRAWEQLADGSPYSELVWLALASVLRECSPVGTAQWQYVLPNKNKLKVVDPYKAFASKIYLMSSDMTYRQAQRYGPSAVLYQEDARQLVSIPDSSVELVITSPPYANNYDYADATRLEMSFFGEVRGWGDLHDAVRQYLVRSCSQHMVKVAGDPRIILEDDLLDPIKPEITQVYDQLELEREKHGGKKAYHTMIAAYFTDMARVWISLRRSTCKGALVCFVVGDSAPYGVYAPVDRWLGELALAAGFRSYRFEKTRDRNIKWKNRKHQVPLHEGRLWVEG